MSKNHRTSLFSLLIILKLTGGCDFPNKKQADKMDLEYLSSKKLDSYPSGSTLSIYDNLVYVMGDDASLLVILDSELNMIDSIPLFENDQIRIEKAKKADIESSEWLNIDGKPKLWLFGSGSLSPQRDSVFCFDPATRKTERKDLSVLYGQIRNLGISELNIEAATLINEQLVFGSRGNLNNKQNYLILTTASVLPKSKDMKTILLDLPEKAGISGMSYLPEKDVLLITSSEENTNSAYDDGEIGESFMGVIYQISEKLSSSTLKPDKWIRLSDLHSDFSQQKIESVGTFRAGQDNKLILISDDDLGGTKLFSLNLKL